MRACVRGARAYACACMCVRRHVRALVGTRVWACECARLYAGGCACARVCVRDRVHVRAFVLTRVRACEGAYMCLCVRERTRACVGAI